MKTTIKTTLVAMSTLLMVVSLASCGKKTTYEFKGEYVPQTEGMDPTKITISFYEDNTYLLTPGIVFNLSEDGTKIVSDGKINGTWSKDESETLSFTVTSIDGSLVRNYTVAKEDGTYAFDLAVNLSGYIRPIPMTLQN